jgi:uncharacterized membrane protein YbhN (UPF0104 family)
MEKLELLKFVADLAERETDRTWRRATVMTTINAGLFVLVSVAIQNNIRWLVSIVSAFGVILAIVWYGITVISKFFEARWHKDMDAIVASDNELAEFVRGRSDPRIPRPRTWRATTGFKIIITLMGAIWLLIFILSMARKLPVPQQPSPRESVKAAPFSPAALTKHLI